MGKDRFRRALSEPQEFGAHRGEVRAKGILEFDKAACQVVCLGRVAGDQGSEYLLALV
jgi:hypothetical protein